MNPGQGSKNEIGTQLPIMQLAQVEYWKKNITLRMAFLVRE